MAKNWTFTTDYLFRYPVDNMHISDILRPNSFLQLRVSKIYEPIVQALSFDAL